MERGEGEPARGLGRRQVALRQVSDRSLAVPPAAGGRRRGFGSRGTQGEEKAKDVARGNGHKHDGGALAPGWQETTDESGRPYYYHYQTGEVRWARPERDGGGGDDDFAVVENPMRHSRPPRDDSIAMVNNPMR